MAIHNELIKPEIFDEKFRDTLRNYYIYGFKSDFKDENWMNWSRLKNILEDDWTNFNKKGKNTLGTRYAHGEFAKDFVSEDEFMFI